MGISDRLLGKKNVNGNPRIEAVHPSAALPGGEVRISGTGLRPPELRRPRVRLGELEGAVTIRAGLDLQDRHQLQCKTLPRRSDECHSNRLRQSRTDVRFVAT